MSNTPVPNPQLAEVDVAIAGGGISGLYAAYRMLKDQPGLTVRVFEASDTLGGCLKGSRLGGHISGTADIGAEASLFVRPETRDLAEELGFELEYPASTHRSGLYVGHTMHELPAGTLMGVPADPKTLTDILSTAGLARAAQEDLGAGPEPDRDVAVGEFLAQRLGDEVVDRLVDPLLAGVYAGRARELSLEATLPGLLPALRGGTAVTHTVAHILDSRRTTRGAQVPGTAEPQAAPVFMTLAGGINRLIDRLVAQIELLGGQVVTSSPVTAIEHGHTRGLKTSEWVVNTSGETLVAKTLILALPASQAARLCAQLAASEEHNTLVAAANALNHTPVADTAVVTTVLELESELQGSGFLVAPTEKTLLKASTFASNKWPWLAQTLESGHAVVRMSVGRYGDAPSAWSHLSDSALTDAAVRDWMNITRRRDRVVHAEVQRWTGALPQYLPGHARRMAELDAVIADQSGLGLVGNAYEGVGIPACLARVNKELARLTPHGK